ncbi:MAG: hypothetical protein GTO45_33735 [Candidatus Aminicenantes bacterium]|nr:hypothetical protein [Candidatus Aminicenantes bacterium]NIM83671.1 hypothetical protein [Candidatus Aminicenantes bacterium]NIN23096.1 hypothetical protein [Candidatus Aminicenantes bacterium]NIN46823.1 hypothetical protein [Candidatus Aminicenantes bacterium]NIN89745.1 hypothetical protein [Candidatus Aminicenantes bacterium]
MQTRRKTGVMVMVIILAISNTGRPIKAAEIKATGKLLIPTAEGEAKPYSGTITITETEISIVCQEKIFQLFNKSDAPKQAKIRMNTLEVKRITQQGNQIIIFPKDSLYNRYRNLLNHVCLISWMKEWERLVFIFVIDRDSSQNIGSNAIKLIDLINQRNDPKCYECGFVKFY